MNSLSQLIIYPIKSARGISVESANVTTRGLRYDRRWMVVDRDNRFLTQRDYPQMALISVEIGDASLHVGAPAMETLNIPISVHDRCSIQVTVWSDEVDAVAMGKGADEWFSEYLKMQCRFVYMPDEADRVASGVSLSSQVSFADAYPFLLISEASLDELNSRLDAALPMNRFRPNIVVKGCEPFAEDTWKEIRIGAMQFHVVKPCARCVITTVDQATAARGKEPLRTLASYREQNGKVMFGQNLIHCNTGVIHVGEMVNVIQTKTHSSNPHNKETIS